MFKASPEAPKPKPFTVLAKITVGRPLVSMAF